MRDSDPRPLLALGIDGVVSLWAAHSATEGLTVREVRRADGKRLRMILEDAHPFALRQLAGRFELAWVTVAGDDANDSITPMFGLPPLHCIRPIARPGGGIDRVTPVLRYGAGRALAWVDQAFGVETHAEAWSSGRHDLPTLLLPTDPALGLTRDDLWRLLSFADRVEALRRRGEPK